MKLKLKILTIAFICLFTSVASAETLPQLQKELLQSNLEIAAAKNRYLAARKLPIQMGTLPDPTVSFTDFGVGHPFSGLNDSDFAYWGIGFTQELPFPGKLSLRSRIAQKGIDAAQQEVRLIEIRLLSELKASFAEHLYLQRAMEIAEKYRDLLNYLTEITEVRYRVGEGLQQDVLRAQLERSTVEEKLQLLRQELESQQAAVNALLNRQVSASLKVEGPFPTDGFDVSLDKLEERLRIRSPEVLTKVAEEEQKQLQLNLAKKDLNPDFAASFQWQKTGSNFPDYYMTMFEVRIPLYYWRKQQPAIAQATLELKASENETKATVLKLQSELKQAYVTATTAATLMKLYNEGIVPQARLSLESATAAYQVGKIEFISLLNNATTLLNYESEFLRRSADHLKAVARIEQLTGELLQPQEIQLVKEFENE